MKLLVDEISELNHAIKVDVQNAILNCKVKLVAAINGADSATGDIVQLSPQHLPSQLQTVKTISQSIIQIKHFIYLLHEYIEDNLLPNLHFYQVLQTMQMILDQIVKKFVILQILFMTTQTLIIINNNNDNNSGIIGRIDTDKDGRFSTNRSHSRSRSKSPFNRLSSNTHRSSNINNSNSTNNNTDHHHGHNDSQFLTAVHANLPTNKSVIGMHKLKQFGRLF